MKTAEERFWAKVDKTGDCWLWTAGIYRGYGRFNTGGKNFLAHVFAYLLANGPVPDGLQLDHRHTCPKRCVRPAHMRLVSAKQNAENRSALNCNNTSGYRGVYWDRRHAKWRARVTHNRKMICVGYFDSAEAANEAAIAARNRLFTHNDLDRAHAV